MSNRKLKYGIILFLLVLSLILGSIILYSRNNEDFKIIFLDVGQGDAILLSQGSYQVLIDGGRDGKLLLEKLGKYIPFWDREIEVILATHPDQDHIAGLIDVLRKYKVKTIIKTQDQSESQTYKTFQEEIEKEKAESVSAKKGTEIKFLSEARAKIIYPFSETGDIQDNGSNGGSTVIKLEIGNENFLLTGDLPKEKESILAGSDLDIASRVLKIAHHGSKYSTSEEFLEKVSPKEAVISVSRNNSYGHPNEEVLNLLKEKNINILRTDEKGDIVFNCKKNLSCQIE